MIVRIVHTIIVGVLGATLTIAAAAQAAERSLGEATEAVIEYPSVADALKALHSKPDVVFTTVNGWTIATDEAAYTIWSFAPLTYPAYPAVVRRQVVAKGSSSLISMAVECEASKAACDELVRTFAQMNGFGLPN